jgi:hypothetical protein
LAPFDAARTAITFVSSFGNGNVGPDGTAPSNTEGFPISPTLPPITLTVKDHGDIVTKRWRVSGNAGACIVMVIETFQPER